LLLLRGSLLVSFLLLCCFELGRTIFLLQRVEFMVYGLGFLVYNLGFMVLWFRVFWLKVYGLG